MNDHTQKLKYLEFIQNIILRMNTNSFQLKTLFITIISAIVGLIISNKSLSSLLYISFAITIIIWCLDAFYLYQEHLFRNLYEDAVKDKNPLFSINIDKYRCLWKYVQKIISKTIWPLYLSILILHICIIFKPGVNI